MSLTKIIILFLLFKLFAKNKNIPNQPHVRVIYNL